MISQMSEVYYKAVIFVSNETYNSVLYTEAQLVFWIGSLNDSHGDRWTVDYAELHLGLVFQVLLRKGDQIKNNSYIGVMNIMIRTL